MAMGAATAQPPPRGPENNRAPMPAVLGTLEVGKCWMGDGGGGVGIEAGLRVRLRPGVTVGAHTRALQRSLAQEASFRRLHLRHELGHGWHGWESSSYV